MSQREVRQFDAATDTLPTGVLLLEASAGTGKTYSLTTLATRMVLGGHVRSIDRLLMVTFTNAATQELRERLRQRLQQARVVLEGGAPPDDDVYLTRLACAKDDAALARVCAALRDYDEVRISTIHGFCARVLQEGAFEAGLPFDAETGTDTSRLRSIAIADAWREIVFAGPAWRAAWLEHQGHRLERVAGDLDLLLRLPGARHRPEVPDVDAIDRAVGVWFERVRADADFAAELRAFAERLRGQTSPYKVGGKGRRIVDLCDRRAAGPLGDDAETWSELMVLTPSVSDACFAKTALKGDAWAALAARGAALEEALDGALLALRRTLAERAAARFAELKRRANVRDFDDLITEVHERVRQDGDAVVRRIASNVDAALIDEFQDTDQRQWEIFRTVFAGKRLVLVGDPKQAIYSFRGADVHAYFGARDAADDRATLPRNWRSHPDLVNAVNHLFAARRRAFAIDELDPEPVLPAKSAPSCALLDAEGRPLSSKLRLEWIDDAVVAAHRIGPATDSGVRPKIDTNAYRDFVAAHVVDHVRALIDGSVRIGDRPVHPGDVAVLTLKHAESRRVQRALRDAGIDAVIAGSGDIRQEEVFQDLVYLLEAMRRPGDVRVLRRALATSVWGATVRDLRSLDDDDASLGERVVRFEELARAWRRRGVFDALSRVVTERDVERRWLTEPGGERRVTDLRHAMEWIHDVETELGSAPEQLVDTLWTQASGREKDEDEAGKLRLERDEKAVKIVTVHASKGLEYDVVLVPFAWETRSESGPWDHHEGPDRDVVIDWSDVKDLAHPSVRATVEERLAERLRLLYVAFTRAKRRCVVFDTAARGGRKGFPTHSALHYLLHVAGTAAVEGEDWLERAIAAFLGSADSWPADLEALASEAPIEFARVQPASGAGATVVERRHEVPALTPRTLPPEIPTRLVPWTVTSFTGLAHGSRSARADAARDEDLLDRDDPAVAAGIVRAPTGIFAFARGAHAGNCLHELLETSDFGASRTDAAHVQNVERVLERHGLLDPTAHVAPIDPVHEALALVERLGDERFPGPEFAMRDVDRAQRLAEWGFRLPVDAIDPSKLATAVRTHVAGALGRDLATRLGDLRQSQRRGLFGGVVDLVFEHHGRWYLIDWKSNHLGDTIDDYDATSMHTSMLDHHYYLQLLFYQVALHRFLGVRLPDYDYDRHCGGGAYVFLRGLSRRADRGWLAWRPERALVEAIDRCFTKAGAA